MTEPLSFIPKELPFESVQAMLFTGTNSQDIIDWAAPLLADGQTISYGGYGYSMRISGGGKPSATVYQNWYFYYDSDGFHAVEKGAFELIMKIDDGV